MHLRFGADVDTARGVVEQDDERLAGERAGNDDFLLVAAGESGHRPIDVTDADVAPTGIYQKRRRLTLTYPLLNRSRRVLWVVTGFEKADMIVRLLNRDVTIPAGRIRCDNALIFADSAAATKLDTAATKDKSCV